MSKLDYMAFQEQYRIVLEASGAAVLNMVGLSGRHVFSSYPAMLLDPLSPIACACVCMFGITVS